MHQARGEAEAYFTYRLFTTILLFGLLAEWLIPWLHAGEWTELLQPRALLVVIGTMLIVGLFRARVVTHVTIAILCSVITLMLLFKGDQQTSWNWLIHFVPELGKDISQMFSYGIFYMSDEIRILLLFAGWILLAPALQSLIWYHQIAFSLLATTVIYLLILYTSLGIDLFYALLRVLVEGILLMALTTMPKLRRKLVISHAWHGMAMHQWIGVVMLTVIMLGGGFLWSQSKERDLEPVAWANVFSESLVQDMSALSSEISGVPLKKNDSTAYSSRSVGASGYSFNDDMLGQTIKPSKDIVFHGWSSIESYWRAESKTEYDGHGWADQSQVLTLKSIPSKSDEVLQSWHNRQGWVGSTIKQEIEYVKPLVGMPIMQSGINGVVLNLSAVNPERDLQNYIVGVETSSIYAPTTESNIKSYSIITELPITDEAVLRDIKPIESDTAEKLWQADTLDRYLQLPDTLPARVAALAAEVSGGGLTSRYDQVKAIEQYLKNNYKYTLNSTVPAATEDFVDQFLFEQQEGYCVHFSTAMVIMLRSQDIPARWVKGYGMGEGIDERTTEAGVVETLYEVRESDAHAWVEVYFPTIGWVPFDPTPTVDSDEHVSSLSRFSQLWNETLTNSIVFLNSLNSTQMLIGLVTSLIVIVTFVMMWMNRYRFKLNANLRGYAKAYVLLKSSSQLVMQALTNDGELPSRNGAKSNELQRARENQQKSIDNVHHSLFQAANYVLQKYEIRLGMQDGQQLQVTTWRTRISALHGLSGSKYDQSLTLVLQWLEQGNYNNPSQQTLPEPKVLRQVLISLLPRYGLRLSKHRRNQLNSVHIDRSATP
ncbi:transglutaminase-like domain-containing protein [Paenibacillus endoradicis]|uniref:transglutaminase-like domain-containing protein n=1 Tax=Paenibacillus endoradicis TaxID=2972487 RepID=UPI002158B5C8|nr:transglutaminase-like domain-containing protein [Paenibacillus endoradicis]MCR8660117.1 transglutaminase-like domain-containing protein [Paenibacillus endoradicis]